METFWKVRHYLISVTFLEVKIIFSQVIKGLNFKKLELFNDLIVEIGVENKFVPNFNDSEGFFGNKLIGPIIKLSRLLPDLTYIINIGVFFVGVRINLNFGPPGN
jgi:hypothetical protein